MINKCPICGAPLNGDENLCSYCGSQIKLKENSEEIKYKSSYTDNTPKQTNHYVPYPHNVGYVQTPPPPPPIQHYNQSIQNNNTQTKKNIGKALFITIGVMIFLFITFVVIVMGVIFSTDNFSSDLSNKDLNSVINTTVNTDNVPLISDEYAKFNTKVEGTSNLYTNGKYLIYNIISSEFIEYGDDYEFYDRKYYIFTPKISNAEYTCDEYSGNLETDDYMIRFYTRNNFNERKENIYIYGEDQLSRLDNLKINGHIFEVYEVIDEYEGKTYHYFSEPIDDDESYVYINLSIYDNECDVDYKEIISHFYTEKTKK